MLDVALALPFLVPRPVPLLAPHCVALGRTPGNSAFDGLQTVQISGCTHSVALCVETRGGRESMGSGRVRNSRRKHYGGTTGGGPECFSQSLFEQSSSDSVLPSGYVYLVDLGLLCSPSGGVVWKLLRERGRKIDAGGTPQPPSLGTRLCPTSRLGIYQVSDPH